MMMVKLVLFFFVAKNKENKNKTTSTTTQKQQWCDDVFLYELKSLLNYSNVFIYKINIFIHEFKLSKIYHI
jgi:hypothetical protein